MTSVAISSNRGAEKSKVIFPAVATSDNTSHQQRAKKRRGNKRMESSSQRSIRERGDRISNVSSYVSGTGDQISDSQETGKTSRGGKKGEFSHEQKQRETSSTSSPYINLPRSPIRNRTVTTSSKDNEKETKTGPNKLRSLRSSGTTRTETSRASERCVLAILIFFKSRFP